MEGKIDQRNIRLQSSAKGPAEINHSAFILVPICKALWFSSGLGFPITLHNGVPVNTSQLL